MKDDGTKLHRPGYRMPAAISLGDGSWSDVDGGDQQPIVVLNGVGGWVEFDEEDFMVGRGALPPASHPTPPPAVFVSWQ